MKVMEVMEVMEAAHLHHLHHFHHFLYPINSFNFACPVLDIGSFLPSARIASQLSLPYRSMRARRSIFKMNDRWMRTKRVGSSCDSMSLMVCCLRRCLSPEANDR